MEFHRPRSLSLLASPAFRRVVPHIRDSLIITVILFCIGSIRTAYLKNTLGLETRTPGETKNAFIEYYRQLEKELGVDSSNEIGKSSAFPYLDNAMPPSESPPQWFHSP